MSKFEFILNFLVAKQKPKFSNWIHFQKFAFWYLCKFLETLPEGLQPGSFNLHRKHKKNRDPNRLNALTVGSKKRKTPAWRHIDKAVAEPKIRTVQKSRQPKTSSCGSYLTTTSRGASKLVHFVNYKINVKLKLGRPRHTFDKQISNYLSHDAGSSLRVEETVRYAKNKSEWNFLIAAPNQPVRWWWWNLHY